MIVATEESEGRKPFPYVAAFFAVLAFAALIALGTWQVERLHWKEGLLATIDQRIHSAPRPLGAIERLFAEKHDVEYWPVTAKGIFLHSGERHFLATWQGDSGFNVYTPLKLDDGRYIFVNRGFVPYARKDPATRPQGEVEGEVTVTGLARNPLAEKPSYIVPDNDIKKNVFYWKDLSVMTATAGLPAGATVLPFFIDAGAAPNPGGLPVGGVTVINLPNNHFQYALTWYGLALVLVVVAGTRLRSRWRAEPEEGRS
ncbi:MAG: SURF1 family protein [Hyphomicrobiales bacterium]|nr:SURF1 family protein [Hyphomicrobiales bacterium]